MVGFAFDYISYGIGKMVVNILNERVVQISYTITSIYYIAYPVYPNNYPFIAI